MHRSDNFKSSSPGRPRWLPSFGSTIALVILVLSALYALTFSHMIYDSLVEQVFAPHYFLPRFAGHTHYHNPAEWVLLVVPAVLGWVGTFASLAYLTRRTFRRTPLSS